MSRYKPRPRAKDSQGEVLERRKARRVSSTDIPSLKSARLLAGPEMRLVNLSSGGALFQSKSRILPGVRICIRLAATDALFLLHGRVLQSRASALSEAGITYQCRIAFDEEFSLLADRHDESLPLAEASERQGIEPADEVTQAFPAVIDEKSASSMTVTVPVPEAERNLRHVFGH
jgi:hypothetical protein